MFVQKRLQFGIYKKKKNYATKVKHFVDILIFDNRLIFGYQFVHTITGLSFYAYPTVLGPFQLRYASL